MTCANASATKPFGAIDTPTQGGAGVRDELRELRVGADAAAEADSDRRVDDHGAGGWRLCSGPWTTTTSARTSRRCSPGYQNTAGANGAVGFRVIDTTTLTNGLHTISWTVVDNQGAIEGIGSRFFTVSNGVGRADGGGRAPASSRASAEAAEVRAIDAPPLDGAGARRSARVGSVGAVAVVWRRRRGPRVIRGEEVDRFELMLGERRGRALHGAPARGRGARAAADRVAAGRDDGRVHVGAGRRVRRARTTWCSCGGTGRGLWRGTRCA